MPHTSRNSRCAARETRTIELLLVQPQGTEKVPQIERPGNHEFLKLGRHTSEFASVRNRTSGDDYLPARIIGSFVVRPETDNSAWT